jgi:hypothetical protein
MTFHWDKLLNFTTGLGIPGAGKGASAEYSLVLLEPDQLEAAYRSDWIVRKAIEIPAFDSTRMCRAWQAEQDQIEALEETEQRHQAQAFPVPVMNLPSEPADARRGPNLVAAEVRHG